MGAIVMTGGTSGFGKITAARLAQTKNISVLLGARGEGSEGVETIPLDLSKLSSVHTFAAEAGRRLGNGKIHALIFNAGISLPGGTKTQDGFETTFAVNHLAHYLLLRLLLPKLDADARIIFTTSGTYDPAEKTIIPPPLHADAKLLAYPELDPQLEKDPKTAGGRAYSSSKLCVLLTARFLARMPEAVDGKWKVTAYDPGPTPGTGLVRSNSPVVKAAWKILGTPVMLPFLPKMNSRRASGEALADLAQGKVHLPEGCIYAALRKGKMTFPELSDLAKRDDLMNALWTDSASLLHFSSL